uniref:Uncharacterized protein n=1 Tax=Anguilla anguilla TaxID=7936 RepID=A0A0E9TXF9_ANGAN
MTFLSKHLFSLECTWIPMSGSHLITTSLPKLCLSHAVWVCGVWPALTDG